MTIAGGLALAGEAKASITYDVSLAIGTGGAGIAGTITTDGKNGVIGASDITAWDLTGTGNGGSTLHIVNGPSVVEVGNNTNPFNVNLGTPDLTADANHIYFNFSATDGGYLAFQAGTNLFGGQRYIGFGANNNSDVYQGFSVVPGSVGDSADIHEGESGNQIIASAATAGFGPYNLAISSTAPSQVTLLWSTNALGWVLESTASLNTLLWNSVTNVPVVDNTNFAVSGAATRTQQFFRLHKASAITGVTLTGATLFRGDTNGNNLNGAGGVLGHGAWTTVLDQQNVPGNYGGEFFLARTPSPGPADFLSPSADLSIPLGLGANTFYFWANGDDTAGGSATFGLNLFFNNAGPTSPSISGYTPPGAGQTDLPNSSPNTGGYNFQYTPGAGVLGVTVGNVLITLSKFEVTGVGGAAAGAGDVDFVNSTNTTPFSPPPHPDGITDSHGQFTLTVSSAP